MEVPVTSVLGHDQRQMKHNIRTRRHYIKSHQVTSTLSHTVTPADFTLFAIGRRKTVITHTRRDISIPRKTQDNTRVGRRTFVMPLEYMVERTSLTVDGRRHLRYVMGQRPTAASVAAATASCSTFISMAQFSK